MKTNSKNSDSLPATMQKYFWDCDVKELFMADHSQFIIERILNFGDDDALHWLLAHTTRSDLINVVQHSKNLSKKARNFWNIVMS